MTPELDLFDYSRTEDGFEIPRVPSRPIGTSKAAAKRVRPAANVMRAQVLEAIENAGKRGMTRKELEESLGLLAQTLCARLWELEGGKLLDGRRQWRPWIRKTAAVREGCHVYVRFGDGDE